MENLNILKAKREKLRQAKKFAEADKIREQIEKMGYSVIDSPESSKIEFVAKNINKNPEKAFLVVFGSGEITSIGRKIHDYVFKQLNKKPIKISIITTPAGFQPNVVAVHEEIAEFFKKSLKNYDPQVSIIYANNSQQANNKELFPDLLKSDYIFIGPGSPTYAVDNLKDTLLLSAILRAVHNGKTLSLASACVLAFSKYTLPVYEIYKVGTELFWKQGLNILAKYIPNETIIPHFNNGEGGAKHDTSYCYMSKERFYRLKNLLPSHEKLLGLDEQTAIVVDMKDKSEKVMGLGSIHDI